MPLLSEVTDALEARFPARGAESWDAVGLVCGDPAQSVSRVLFAVDPVRPVVDEAIARGADLLVTHHPLLLRSVHAVAATTPKGEVVHRLIKSGTALLTLHTNADSARPGASDALAEACGLHDTVPLVPHPAAEQIKLVTFVPHDDADRVIDALAEAGAGVIGAYERCAWTTSGDGTFRAGAGATPSVGTVGVVERVPEVRVEMVASAAATDVVVSALRAVHPYEEPAFDLLVTRPHPAGSAGSGLGRVGALPGPQPLGVILQRLARALPPTVGGIRATGTADQVVTRVAVCGGAGDSLLSAARDAGADVYVTADLRHHPASEAAEQAAFDVRRGRPPMALVDLSHWASEWLWLPAAAQALRHDVPGLEEVAVSTRCTDPWTQLVPMTGGA